MISAAVIEALKEIVPAERILFQEPMKLHTTFRIGGPASLLCFPETTEQLKNLLAACKTEQYPILMLGAGSNLLVADEGLDAVVIATERLNDIAVEGNTIRAEAGVSLARLAQFAQSNGLAGLEFASGIPGSVGGGILMNAGAYGGEMKDVVESVVMYYLTDQALCEVKSEDCGFGYRQSSFTKVNCAITGAVFKLTKDEPEAIAARMHEMNEKRRKNQPLDLPSAGSAFKRPVGGYAAALIDEAGLKGYTVGGAQVSEKHAGFVVNKGGASYDDIVALMDHVRREVYEKSGITLEPEIRIYPKGVVLIDDWKRRKQMALDEMLKMAKEQKDKPSEEK